MSTTFQILLGKNISYYVLINILVCVAIQMLFKYDAQQISLTAEKYPHKNGNNKT